MPPSAFWKMWKKKPRWDRSKIPLREVHKLPGSTGTRLDQSAKGQEFPRSYRVDERTRRAVNFLLFALTGLFLFFTALHLVRGTRRDPRGLMVTDLTIGGIVLFLGSGYNKQVILYRDAIEVAGWFYSRKLSFAEIRGRQTTANSRIPGYAYVFVSSDRKKRKLVLPRYLHTDHIFREWIETIPQVPH